jgi:hypothetical protein
MQHYPVRAGIPRVPDILRAVREIPRCNDDICATKRKVLADVCPLPQYGGDKVRQTVAFPEFDGPFLKGEGSKFSNARTK